MAARGRGKYQVAVDRHAIVKLHGAVAESLYRDTADIPHPGAAHQSAETFASLNAKSVLLWSGFRGDQRHGNALLGKGSRGLAADEAGADDHRGAGIGYRFPQPVSVGERPQLQRPFTTGHW